MTKLSAIKVLALAALFGIAGAGSAHAVPLTIDVLLGAGGTETLSVGSPLASNITLTNINTQFSKALGASISGGILTVGNGHPKSIYGYADFTITPLPTVAQPNIFGFTWLNPGVNQNIQVTTADASGGLNSHSISGDLFAPYITGADPLNIVIIDPFAVLTSAEFDSLFGNGTTTGFRVTNFAVASNLSAVPLPGTVGLFLTAVAGLFLMRRKLGKVKI